MLKLKLQNFRRFTETQPIAFGPGLTIVSGPNGAGKSTLIESLSYALFGAERNAPEIVSDSAAAGEEPYVECELFVDGQSLAVHRWGNRAEVWLNGSQQVQAGPGSSTLATKEIRRLLGGLTREQFAATYVAMQGDTAGLVTEKGAQRRKIIEAVLQLDVLKEAAKYQQQRRGEFRNDLDVKAGVAISELSLNSTAWDSFKKKRALDTRLLAAQQFLFDVEQALCRREQEHEAALSSERHIEDELGKLQIKHDEIQGRIRELRDILPAHEAKEAQSHAFDPAISSLAGQILQVGTDLKTLQEQIKEAQSYSQAATEHTRVAAEIQKKKDRLAQLPLVESRFHHLERARQDLEDLDQDANKLAGADKALQDSERDEETKKEKWESLQQDPIAAEYQAWQAEKVRVDFQEQGWQEALQVLVDSPGSGACPTCGQTFSAHNVDKRIAHLRQWLGHTLPQLRNDLQTKESDLERKRSAWQLSKQKAYSEWFQAFQALQKAQTRVTRLHELTGKRTGLDRDLHKATDQWELLREAHAFDPSEESAVQREIERLSRVEQHLSEKAKLHGKLEELLARQSAKTTEYRQLGNERDKLLRDQNQVGYDSYAHDKAKQELEEAQGQVNSLERELSRSKAAKSNAAMAAEAAKEKVDQARRLQSGLRDALSAFQREDKLSELLEGFQAHFFGACVEHVVQRTRDLVLHAVTDQSILGIRFEGDDLFYLDASHHKRPVSRLSGGEKALAGLCLRIALAERAQTILGNGRLGFLILDEVLGALDEERREEVQRIFEDVLHHGLFQHIIMITHLDSLKHSWQANGLEVRKVDAKSSQVYSVRWNGIEGMEAQDEQPAK